jgi:large subunit ribosomal protein L24
MTNKMKIKKGDTVKVLSGKDKGKTGKVLSVDGKRQSVVVENINLHTRFERSKKAGQPGSKVVFAGSMPVGKVQLVDPGSGKPTRIGYKILENGTKQRVARGSGQAV